jgi:hypothetical protein
MGSIQHPQVFAPRDLEIIDRVYKAAWASITARDPFRDTASDGEHQEVLRKRIMHLTGGERIEFDALYEKVFANLLEPWTTVRAPQPPPRSAR